MLIDRRRAGGEQQEKLNGIVSSFMVSLSLSATGSAHGSWLLFTYYRVCSFIYVVNQQTAYRWTALGWPPPPPDERDWVSNDYYDLRVIRQVQIIPVRPVVFLGTLRVSLTDWPLHHLLLHPSTSPPIEWWWRGDEECHMRRQPEALVSS